MLPLILALLLQSEASEKVWDAKQGQTLIIDLDPIHCVGNFDVFGKKYKCDRDFRLIIGVDFEQPADSYPLTHFRWGTLGRIQVGQTGFPVKTRYRKGPPAKPTPKREVERQVIATALNSGEQQYPHFRTPRTVLTPLDETYVSGDPFGLFREYQTPKGRKLATDHHRGVDLGTNRRVGLAVYAIADGVVVLAKRFSLEGNMVILYHGGEVYSLYLHVGKLLVQNGNYVSGGHRIALSGNTGASSGPHLHFAIKVNGAVVDPLQFIEVFKKQ